MSKKAILKKAKERKEVNKPFASMTALEKAYFGVYGKQWLQKMKQYKLR